MLPAFGPRGGAIINHNRRAALRFWPSALDSGHPGGPVAEKTDLAGEYRPRILDLPTNDRPRERLQREGPAVLSNAELLAILLRVGIAGENAVRVAERLLAQLDGLAGLHRAGYADLRAQKGIGPAKAAQLQAAIELGRRIASSPLAERTAINSPADAANLLMYQLPNLHARGKYASLY